MLSPMLSLGHPAPKLEAEFWRMRWVWGNRCQYLPWLRKPLRAPSSGNMARTHIETTVPRRIKSQSERPLCLCRLQYSSMNGWMRSESRWGIRRQVMHFFFICWPQFQTFGWIIKRSKVSRSKAQGTCITTYSRCWYRAYNIQHPCGGVWKQSKPFA